MLKMRGNVVNGRRERAKVGDRLTLIVDELMTNAFLMPLAVVS